MGIFLAIIFIVAVVMIIIPKVQNEQSDSESSGNTTFDSGDVRVPKELTTNIKIKEPVKRIVFTATGINYEGRRKVVSKIVNDMKKEDYFKHETYEGMTNREILEDGYRVYELSAEAFPGVSIKKEDDNPFDKNAIKVIIYDIHGDPHHIGYIPAKYCVEIRDYISKYRTLVASTITGGKYKDVIYDDYGDEKVKVFNSKYGVKVTISFWDDEETGEWIA